MFALGKAEAAEVAEIDFAVLEGGGGGNAVPGPAEGAGDLGGAPCVEALDAASGGVPGHHELRGRHELEPVPEPQGASLHRDHLHGGPVCGPARDPDPEELAGEGVDDEQEAVGVVDDPVEAHQVLVPLLLREQRALDPRHQFPLRPHLPYLAPFAVRHVRVAFLVHRHVIRKRLLIVCVNTITKRKSMSKVYAIVDWVS